MRQRAPNPSGRDNQAPRPGLLSYLAPVGDEGDTQGHGQGGYDTYVSPDYMPTPEQVAETADLDEQWDIYYHSFLLHSCLHSQCYWHRSTWWFPEPGRNSATLSMFTPSRTPVTDDIMYYDLHLVGDIAQAKLIAAQWKLMFRYVGQSNPDEAWLQDYVGYNLNFVTFDMKVIPPGSPRG
ncbi:hypothetical protein IAU60_003931 [Kwoniella sp. DSM 27419]